MPKQTLRIQSVLGGISPSQYFAGEGQYSSGIGIDPDFPITSSDTRTSGAIVPSVYEKFSASEVNSHPVAIIRTPKSSTVYVVLANGKLISYSSSLGSETLIGTVTGSVANGAFYYNNPRLIINAGGQGSSKTFSTLQVIYNLLKSGNPYKVTFCSYALPTAEWLTPQTVVC